MSKLSGLKSKGKMYTIGGIELEIKPLGVDDFELFDVPEDADLKENIDSVMKLVTKVIKESVPDATDEEIKKYVKLDHINEIKEAIMDVCGMKDNKGNITDAIQTRQAQIQAARTPK
uniref:Tail assembly chaperone n=1 Tax=viral metagenome TaxID=1070528 RepID=A0A6H1ZVG1_9ZZZZ